MLKRRLIIEIETDEPEITGYMGDELKYGIQDYFNDLEIKITEFRLENL